jgi:hypothetical protein
MRIIRELVRRIMLIDLDASAAIGVQYSWSKHSLAYMPPEAIRLFLSLVCSDFAVGDAPTSAQFTVEFQFSLPIEIAAGSSFTIAFAPVKVTGVLSLILDDAVDLSSCLSVEDHVIIVMAKDTLAAGSRRVKMVATFNGNPTAAGSMSAHLGHVVNTLRPVPGACKDSLAKCTVTIRNPMKDAVVKQQEQLSPTTAASAVAEQHTQLRPETSSRALPSLAPAKRAPAAAATSTPPYPLFLSESVILSTSSKLPSLPFDVLSPAVAEAAAVMQNEYAHTAMNVHRDMRSLQKTWLSLHRISFAASGMTHSPRFAVPRLLSFL